MPELDDTLLTRLLREQARSVDTSDLALLTRPAQRSRHRRVAVVAAPAAVVVVLAVGAAIAENRPNHRSGGNPASASSNGPSPTTVNVSPPATPVHKPNLGAFAAACGHPGTTVTVATTPVTVRRADCDLTGVIVRLSNGYGSVVPARGTSEGDVDSGQGATPASGGILVDVNPDTGDVTISAVS